MNWVLFMLSDKKIPFLRSHLKPMKFKMKLKRYCRKRVLFWGSVPNHPSYPKNVFSHQSKDKYTSKYTLALVNAAISPNSRPSHMWAHTEQQSKAGFSSPCIFPQKRNTKASVSIVKRITKKKFKGKCVWGKREIELDTIVTSTFNIHLKMMFQWALFLAQNSPNWSPFSCHILSSTSQNITVRF